VQGLPAEDRDPSAVGVSANEARGVAGSRPAAARATGVAFVVGSALAFGAMAIMARLAYADGVDTPTLLALRFSIAAACLAAIVRWRGVALPRGRDLRAVALLGGVGYGGQAGTFFTALTLAPAGLVALLLYLHPALVAVLAALFLRERITPVKLAALAIALAGTTLTVAPALLGGATGEFPRLPAGIAFGLAAAAIYAVYIIVGTRLTARIEPLALSTVVVISAAAVFTVAAAVQGPRFPHSAAGWLAIAGIALISTVAAITLFFAGLARVGPTQASTLSTIEPLFTVLLAATLLGERIAPIQMAGGLAILGAVILLAKAPAAGMQSAAPAATRGRSA
jgi:drug/metabolite transporter (DMT)-like permease